MELEDLKNSWKVMENQISRLEDRNRGLMDKVVNNRVVSAQQRLIQKYRAMTIICLCAPSWIGMMRHSLDEIENVTIYMCIFMVFLLIMAGMKGFMWWRLSHWDYRQMTVKEALSSTYKLSKCQNMNTLVGMTLAIPLIVCFMIALHQLHDSFLIGSAWCGLIVGLFIGLRIRQRMKREIKEMQDTLSDI